MACGKSLFECELLHIGGQFFLRLGADGMKFHTEGAQDVGEVSANVAVAHNARALVGEFDEGIVPAAEVAAVSPKALAVGLGIVACACCSFEQEGCGHLCYSAATVAGCVAHRDASPACSFNVNDVISGGGHADQLQPGQVVEVGFGKGCFVDYQHFGVGGSMV